MLQESHNMSLFQKTLQIGVFFFVQDQFIIIN